MASDGDWAEVGHMRDATGDEIHVDVLGARVRVVFVLGNLLASMYFDAPQREQFQRLFMEAERQAEARTAPRA